MTHIKRSLIAMAIATSYVSASHAGCVSASGKITNNAQLDHTTLGVVAIKLGGENYKCGITGKPNGSNELGLPKFTHTIVCDNKAESGSPQGQLIFDTSMTSLTPTGSCVGPSYSAIGAPFSFHEDSSVIPGTGRGLFDGATGGGISVNGIFNCEGGIRMSFSGNICFD